MNFIETVLLLVKYKLQRVIGLSPSGRSIGNVLISYITRPFLKHDVITYAAHSNQWECFQIAQIFLELGYCVDIINYYDDKFVPNKKYQVFIDIHSNLERLSPVINPNCLKILHITGAHWLFQNNAEYSRLLALQKRRGFTLIPRRIAKPSLGIEHANYATILGNDFTLSTFSYANKPICKIPVSTTTLFEFDDDKDFEKTKKTFLWLGSGGLVLKGLNLALEAFSQLPDYHLIVCGPIKNECDFANAFRKELYDTPNIKTVGWIDIKSPDFLDVINNCVGLIYPSASEGQAGSVVVALHAGLIPIVSYQSGVDIEPFGICLQDCSISEIKEAIIMVSKLPVQELKKRSRAAWEFARKNHTRERFSEEYSKFLNRVLS